MSYDLSKLTHVQVSQLWNEREQIFKDSEVDLAVNQEIDSSGIAFLVQWAKAQSNQQLVIHNASHTVKSLIITFHLEPLFKLV